MKRWIPAMVVLAAGCSTSEELPKLLLPESVDVEWNDAYNAEDDGLGALVPIDVMAYEANSGDPMAGVRITVQADQPAVWPVRADGVEVRGDQWDAPDDVVWDASRDEFLRLVDHAGADGELELVTNTDGVARLYLFADAFIEGSASGFESVGVLVSLDRPDSTRPATSGDAGVFQLHPR